MDQILCGVEKRESFEMTGERDANSLFEFCDEQSVVLDIGSGIGRISKFLAPRVERYLAIEPSSEMRFFSESFLDETFQKVKYEESTSQIESESVDLAFSIFTFQHLRQEECLDYLKDLMRILRSQGLFYSKDKYNKKNGMGLQFEQLREYFSIQRIESRQPEKAPPPRYQIVAKKRT